MRAALAAALLVLSGPVAAGEPPEGPAIPQVCKPLSEALAVLPEDAEWAPLPDEAVAPMLAFHNALPPVGHESFASATLVMFAGGALIFWMRTGYVCDHTTLAPPLWQRLKPLIEGHRV